MFVSSLVSSTCYIIHDSGASVNSNFKFFKKSLTMPDKTVVLINCSAPTVSRLPVDAGFETTEMKCRRGTETRSCTAGERLRYTLIMKKRYP